MHSPGPCHSIIPATGQLVDSSSIELLTPARNAPHVRLPASLIVQTLLHELRRPSSPLMLPSSPFIAALCSAASSNTVANARTPDVSMPQEQSDSSVKLECWRTRHAAIERAPWQPIGLPLMSRFTSSSSRSSATTSGPGRRCCNSAATVTALLGFASCTGGG
jgi:hypothetical protein